jgi:hypothetical protein
MKKTARKGPKRVGPSAGPLLPLLHAIVRRDLREFVVDAEMGAHAEAMERLTRAVPAIPRERLRVVSVGQTFEPVEGVIRAKGLHDELGGEMYAIVETPDRAAYYVRLRPEVAHELREGEKVRLTSPTEKWVKANDPILVQAAARNGGVYDSATHQRAL